MDLSPDTKITFESARLLHAGRENIQLIVVGLHTALGGVRRSALKVIGGNAQGQDDQQRDRLYRVTLARHFEVLSREVGEIRIAVYEKVFRLRVFEVIELADTQHLHLMEKLIADKLGPNGHQHRDLILRILEKIMVGNGGVMQVKRVNPRRVVPNLVWYPDGVGSLAAVSKPRGDNEPSRDKLTEVLKKELQGPEESSDIESLDEK